MVNFCTRTPFTLEFPHSERGKTVWFYLRWTSNTNEAGRWTEFASAVIP